MVASTAARALGTGLQVAVTDENVLDRAWHEVLTVFDAVDRAVSRFRDDSDLSLVNARAGEWVCVEPLTLEAITVALQVAGSTDGAVDPTVGAALQAIGYDRDFADVEGHGGRATAADIAGWRRVEVDRGGSAVRIPQRCVLDLGATAKALAADRAARRACDAIGAGVLVNSGGDIAVAGGCPPGGWAVRVTDDHASSSDAPGQTVVITGGGLATSSTTVRRWRRADGADAHHIVDPQSGEPAPVVWRTVSAVAESCVAANAATTAAIVLGDAAPAWLEERGIPARLVRAGGGMVRTAGWPGEGQSL